MSKILVTGSEGFVGSRVRKVLEEKGHEVFGFDIKDEDDLCDSNAVDSAVEGMDVVFHIGAQADLTTMYDIGGANRGFNDNVVGTSNVAKACAEHGVWMVYASTVCVYGNVPEHPEKEDSTLPNPSEMYACTKYAAEWVMRGYGYNFNMPWTSLRFATIYGPGQRGVMGMQIFIDQALDSQDITVHGDGSQDRTLTHVDDIVAGVVSVLDSPEKAKGQVFNISAPEAISAQKMAEDTKALIPGDYEILNIKQRDNQTIHEDFDVTKAKELLGWEAKISWEDGLAQTVEYTKNHE